MSPSAPPARSARLSSAAKRSSKPRRFSAPVSASARERRLSSLRWCSWMRACQAHIQLAQTSVRATNATSMVETPPTATAASTYAVTR
jgi:hypothetical protein